MVPHPRTLVPSCSNATRHTAHDRAITYPAVGVDRWLFSAWPPSLTSAVPFVVVHVVIETTSVAEIG